MLTPPAPSSDPLVRSVDHTMTTHTMLEPDDRVLVGLSGGPDSTALLLCLHGLAKSKKISLGAAHLNHGLRGERADEDARCAADLAAKLGLPIVTARQSVTAYQKAHRKSPEEAAREVRYRFLLRVAADGGFNRIALGHQRDDDAELMLMRFLRGSGPLGLAGIPPIRSAAKGQIRIIRPLIRASRAEIMAFLKRCGVRSAEDESNTDARFLRNRIRHQLLPLLTEHYNPALVEGLSRMAHLMRDEEDWLADATASALDAVILEDHGSLQAIDRRKLAAYHPALQRRVLRAALQRCKGNLRRIGFTSLENARNLAVHGPERGACHLPDGICVRGQGPRLIIQRLSRLRGQGRPASPAPPEPRFEYTIPAPGRFAIREAGITLVFSLLPSAPPEKASPPGQPTALFDMDKLQFPLVVRNFRPGDRMAPLGLNGTQKVKKIFIDRKIARENRPRYALLLSGDQILWIVGVRQSAIAPIEPTTKRWLKVEIVGCLSGQDGYY